MNSPNSVASYLFNKDKQESLNSIVWAAILKRQLDYLHAFTTSGYLNTTVYQNSIVGWRIEGKKKLEIKVAVERGKVRVDHNFVIQKSDGQKVKSKVHYLDLEALDDFLEMLLPLPVLHTSLDLDVVV